MSARTRLLVADYAGWLAFYALFVVAVEHVHGVWPNVGLWAAYLLAILAHAYVYGLARDKIRADEQRRPERPPNPFAPPSFYCPTCDEWSLGSMTAFNAHRREHTGEGGAA